MSTITLESIQNELIREILDIKNVKVLESVRKTLVHAKKEMESVSTMVAEDEEPYTFLFLIKDSNASGHHSYHDEHYAPYTNRRRYFNR